MSNWSCEEKEKEKEREWIDKGKEKRKDDKKR